jgi:integrase
MECIHRRGKVYCAVINVPTDLQFQLGKKQIWRSLKTTRYETAKSYARHLSYYVDQLFLLVRFGMLDVELVNAMVADYAIFSLRINDYVRQRTRAIQPENPLENRVKKLYAEGTANANERTLFAEEFKKIATTYQDALAEGLPEKVDGIVDTCKLWAKKFKVFVAPDTDEFRQLLTAFGQTEKLLTKIEAERILGITDESELQRYLLEKWNKNLPVKKDVGIPLPELFSIYVEQWKNDNPARIKRKIRELRYLEESFRECFSRVIAVKEIDEDKAEEWRNYIKDEYELGNKTVNNYIKTMSAVFNLALERKRKLVDFNPFSTGLILPLGKANEQSRCFSEVELQKYIEVLAEEYDSNKLELTWLPLIMMYSGMRPNEVAQLYLDDVQEIEGINFFRICKNAERKQRVKSNSERDVPIHEQLKELGFMVYVEKMRDAGEKQLFPNCRYQSGIGYYYSNDMSCRLNATINLHIAEDKKLRLYSMRKNFRSALDNIFTEKAVASIKGRETTDLGAYQQYFERAVNDILGHAVKGTTGDRTYRV